MTQTLARPAPPVSASAVPDEPRRRAKIQRGLLIETSGALVASFAVVWLSFTIADVSGPLGFGICVVLGFFVTYAMVCWRLHGVMVMKDRLATAAIWVGALVAFIPLCWVIGYVIYRGVPVVWADFPHFFYANFNGYVDKAPVTAVGAGAAIIGSVEQVGLATLFTVPLAVLTATYLVNYQNAFARVVRNVVDAMNGSPAIIAGIFVYLFWVRPRGVNGNTGFAGAMALSVVMLPIVTRAAQEVISIVPSSLTEAALALGSPRWRSILRVTLPTARVGLVTAVILGIARIAGETAPVLFTVGGTPHYNWNPFSGPQDDLPFRIDQMIFQPGVNATRDAWGVAFVLVLVVLLLFMSARLIGTKKPGPSRWRTWLRSRSSAIGEAK